MSHAAKPLARTGAALAALSAITLGTFGVAADAAAAASSRTDMRVGIVDIANDIRADHGCRSLKMAKQLTTSAQRHADDMSRTRVFSHTSANGRSWVARQLAAGWKDPGGENIARGFDNPRSVMKAWMNSPEHRRNILNCSFRYIGVGYSAKGEYSVQNFGY
jgi:uncharacterized protein YkwD